VTIGDTTLNWTDLLSIGNSNQLNKKEPTSPRSTGRSFYVETVIDYPKMDEERMVVRQKLEAMRR
jgi:hypothetical protein